MHRIEDLELDESSFEDNTSYYIDEKQTKKIENEISELQSRFMAGKGTREGFVNLRMICERYSEVNQDVYACFIHYEEAFDRC